MPPETIPLTRRRVLLGAASSPLLFLATACTDEPLPTVAPDPDRDALQTAYEIEDALRDRLAIWAASPGEDRATAVLVVDSHREALSTALGGASPPQSSASASASTPESSPAQSAASVTRALDGAADAHSRALRTASPPISPLLASIAASDAALAASLRASSR